MIEAVGYMRTSSAANVGEGKDSEPRQRIAISGFAAEAGYTIAEDGWFYDPKVIGKDAIGVRPGFAAMLVHLEERGIKAIIVESPDRFARDLLVQLTGHDHLKAAGIALIPASAPDYFLQDTPTAILIRQILGAVAEFEKASLVAKLKAARDRKREATGRKVGGRKSYIEINPKLVSRAMELRPGRSLREVAALLYIDGFATPTGRAYAPMAVRSMLQGAMA